MIVRTGPRTYELRSRSTERVLGTHPSYDSALRQERAIKASQARAAKRNPLDVPPWTEWSIGHEDGSRGLTIDGEKYLISPMYKLFSGKRLKKKPIEYDWIAMTLAYHPRGMSTSKTAMYIDSDGRLTNHMVRFVAPSEAVNAVRMRHANRRSEQPTSCRLE